MCGMTVVPMMGMIGMMVQGTRDIRDSRRARTWRLLRRDGLVWEELLQHLHHRDKQRARGVRENVR